MSNLLTEQSRLQVELETERDNKDKTLQELQQLRSKSTDYVINMEEQSPPTTNEGIYTMHNDDIKYYCIFNVFY